MSSGRFPGFGRKKLFANALLLVVSFLMLFLIQPVAGSSSGSGVDNRGGLEIFTEDVRAIGSADIEDVHRPELYNMGQFGIPLEFSDAGSMKFAEASEGKGGHPAVIYLDRPLDSALLFTDEFLDDLEADQSIERVRYVKEDQTIELRFEGSEVWVPVQVDALKIETDEIPQFAKQYLVNNVDMIEKAIYLGEVDELDSGLREDSELLAVNNERIALEERPKLENETAWGWFKRVVGIKSYPIISSDVAGEPMEEFVIQVGDPSSVMSVYRRITADETESIVESYETSVTAVSLHMDKEESNFNLDIENLERLPTGVEEPDQSVYEYLEIESKGLDHVERASIEFKVSQEWIQKNDIDDGEVALFKYENGWKELDTSKLLSIGEYIYYEAETPGFSTYAISGDEDDGLPLMWIGVGIVAVIVIIIGALAYFLKGGGSGKASET